MPLLILGAKLWNFIAAVVGMVLDVVLFWNHVCDVVILSCCPLDVLTSWAIEMDAMAEVKITERSIILRAGQCGYIRRVGGDCLSTRRVD